MIVKMRTTVITSMGMTVIVMKTTLEARKLLLMRRLVEMVR